LNEFQLKAGDFMSFEQFKDIIVCNVYLGFSPENSADLNHLVPPRAVRRLSHKRLSIRRLSNANAQQTS
jgi:hypothetical protein